MIGDDENLGVPEPEAPEVSEAEEPQIEEPAEPESEDQDLAPPTQPENRVERRIRQEIERRRALEAELQQLRINQQAMEDRLRVRANWVDPAERQRRLDAMDPFDRVNYLREEDRNEFRSAINRIEFHQLAQNDAMSFQTYLAANPEYRRYEIDVENLFNQSLQKGQPQSRNAILSWVIGETVRSKTPAAVSKAKKAANERIEKVTTRPTTGRSNVAAGERRPMTAEERLFSNLERGAYGNQT